MRGVRAILTTLWSPTLDFMSAKSLERAVGGSSCRERARGVFESAPLQAHRLS